MLKEEITEHVMFGGTDYAVTYSQEHELSIDFAVNETDNNDDNFIEGDVKWDHCTNYTFPSVKHCMAHACDREGLLGLGELLAHIYDQSIGFMKAQGVLLK